MPDLRPVTLTNPRSDRVRAIKALSGRSARRRSGRFLVEGPQAVRELVRFRPGDILGLYLTSSAARRYDEIVSEAMTASVSVQLAEPPVIEAMSGDAQGVLAVADSRAVCPAGDPVARLDTLLEHPPSLVAVLCHVRDPGNAGAVIRAADAAGAGLVILSEGSVEALSPKVVRSSAGSLFHLPVLAGVRLEDVTARLRSAGLVVMAADGAGDTTLDALVHPVAGTAATVDLSRPAAWVFGNEAWGLSETERAQADAVVRVPIHGHAESLNLATAATVCLYASAFAQH